MKKQANSQGIKQARSFENVMNAALWNLSQRDMTEYQLRQKLCAKTDNMDWVNEAIHKLQQFAYLKPDLDFAIDFCRVAFASLFGSGYVLKKLKEKGVSERDIHDAIERVSNTVTLNEQARVNQYINDKYISFSISKEKLKASLITRGFTHSQVKIAIAQHPDSSNLKSNLTIKSAKANLETEVLKYVRKGKGLKYIRQQLKVRQVDITDLADVVSRLIDNESIDFYQSCSEELAKKSYDLTNFKERSKAYVMLLNKGFSTDEIKYAIEGG